MATKPKPKNSMLCQLYFVMHLTIYIFTDPINLHNYNKKFTSVLFNKCKENNQNTFLI